jgi:hypothetical protein
MIIGSVRERRPVAFGSVLEIRGVASGAALA